LAVDIRIRGVQLNSTRPDICEADPPRPNANTGSRHTIKNEITGAPRPADVMRWVGVNLLVPKTMRPNPFDHRFAAGITDGLLVWLYCSEDQPRKLEPFPRQTLRPRNAQ
jgi:hypothetical protein